MEWKDAQIFTGWLDGGSFDRNISEGEEEMWAQHFTTVFKLRRVSSLLLTNVNFDVDKYEAYIFHCFLVNA